MRHSQGKAQVLQDGFLTEGTANKGGPKFQEEGQITPFSKGC